MNNYEGCSNHGFIGNTLLAKIIREQALSVKEAKAPQDVSHRTAYKWLEQLTRKAVKLPLRTGA
jgi:transposase